MWLLPGAERERRALLLGAALILAILLSWWPSTAVERVCDRALGFVAPPIATAAFWIGRLVAPASARSPMAEAPAAGWLDAAERAVALPKPVSGLAWIEVPVVGIERQGSALRLGAGSRIGLAEGMVAACGGAYLGRITEVEEDRALLLHYRAADERTGVRLQSAAGEDIGAILIGRSRRPALLSPIADGATPNPGCAVQFRGRRSDPPALVAAGLELGVCASFGDLRRGEQAWVVEGTLPSLAEGRVYVAAGALPLLPVKPPEPAQADAVEALRWDAVLGSRFSAYALSESLPHAPTVALRAGRVLGPVHRQRGRLCWIRNDDASHWIERGAALAAPDGSAAPGWFTRGLGGVPRGLWLAAPGDLPPPTGAVQFLVAPFTREL
ncbi:MAG: hypothetical protein O3A20_09865 [Planctomycetota bacterium]|nr:hypothetical protein [Planctomycetota bacterium]